MRKNINFWYVTISKKNKIFLHENHIYLFLFLLIVILSIGKFIYKNKYTIGYF